MEGYSSTTTMYSTIVRTGLTVPLGNIITKFQVSFIPLDCSTLALVTSDQVLLRELVFLFIKSQVMLCLLNSMGK